MKNANIEYNVRLEQELKHEITQLKHQRDMLRHALEMVRDADNDCHSDGLPTMPSVARDCIDQALGFVIGGAAK